MCRSKQVLFLVVIALCTSRLDASEHEGKSLAKRSMDDLMGMAKSALGEMTEILKKCAPFFIAHHGECGGMPSEESLKNADEVACCNLKKSADCYMEKSSDTEACTINHIKTYSDYLTKNYCADKCNGATSATVLTALLFIALLFNFIM